MFRSSLEIARVPPRAFTRISPAIFNPQWVYFRIGSTKNNWNAFRCIPLLYLDPRNTRACMAHAKRTRTHIIIQQFWGTFLAIAERFRRMRRKAHYISCFWRKIWNFPSVVKGSALNVTSISTLRKNIVNFNKYLVQYCQLNIYLQ